MINSTVSGNNIYYYIKTSGSSGLSDRETSAKILSSPKKSDSAETFLKKLHHCIKEINVIKLPEETTLNRVVDQVLSGYQSKLDNLGILSRSWLCFLKVITYPLGFFGIHVTQLQKIRYYAKTIKVLGESQSALLSTDPDFALKRKLITALPEDSPERGKILKYNLEQCLQAKTDNNPEMIFDACQAYLKRGEAAKAKELLLGMSETGNSGRDGDLFTEVVSTCIEKEIPAIDLIEKMLALPPSSISDKNMDIIASSCEKAGKLHQFVAAIDALPIDKNKKTILYDGFVKECLKKIDLNETELRSKECRQLLSSLLDKMSRTHAQMTAKMFFSREEYLFAIKAANIIYYEEEGKALLIEISSICTKNGHFEMALKSLEKIGYLKDEELPIAQAFIELIVASMEENIDFANEVLQQCLRSKPASPIKIKIRASAEHLFERAMELKNYRIACDALQITGDVQDDLL